MTALLLATACDREPDFEAPAKVQIVCAPATTSTSMSTTTSPRPSAPSAVEPMVLVLDTGDRSVRWVNGPGAPAGVLTVEDHQYVLRFGQGAAAWRAALNRFDGAMVREPGKAGAAQTRQHLTCKREVEGPKF